MTPAARYQLTISDLQVDAEIGARVEERGQRQKLLIDLVADIAPGGQDDIAHTVDYRIMAERACALALAGHIALIETFARRIAEAMLAIDGIAAISVWVRKPSALAPAMAGVRLTAGRSAT